MVSMIFELKTISLKIYSQNIGSIRFDKYLQMLIHLGLMKFDAYASSVDLLISL